MNFYYLYSIPNYLVDKYDVWKDIISEIKRQNSGIEIEKLADLSGIKSSL